jgi:glutaminase
MINEPNRINPIPELLDALVGGLREDTGGTVASYIPELAYADPEHFGLAMCTLDGHVYAAGEADVPFTIQSVSKPFVYALALDEFGLDEVMRRVGVEPSGEAFNAIRLEPGTGRPPNPMVNAGAILTTSLLPFDRILDGLARFAGRTLPVDETVYASEYRTGDLNRSLAYLMSSLGALTADPLESTAAYFRQCSVRVTASDLAVMAGVLANAGAHPVTGERIVSRDSASQVLTVMASCGMYDFSGEWLLRVGLPAKSGVSGGLVAALPAQFGIGLYSPRLDQHGNSVRAIGACEELSARFGLHVMNPVVRKASAVYERRDLSGGIAVRRLEGDLGFAGTEPLTRELAGSPPSALVLDLDRVGDPHPAALRMLDRLVQSLAEDSVPVVVVDHRRRGLLRNAETEFGSLGEAQQYLDRS